jgi:hypothetical protein
MRPLRFRQIHLDFHTSEKIPGVGSEFNAEEFVETLRRARVNAINLFSRCHHGMIYHDTRFPSRHPYLTCNLLAEQIQACHKHDIRCPIYITVGWDEYSARLHPEWIEVDAEGRRVGAGPLQPGWKNLCFASPYLDYVVEQTEEVLDMFGDEVDGIWFDIIFQNGVHGRWCMEEYAKLGWDPADPKAQDAMRERVVNRCKERLFSAVRAKNRDCLVFFNAGHISPSIRPTLHTYTHLDLESLPTGGWGYAHFPITMRYARGLGLGCVGMTGKFAKTWGHFNSYKPQAALEYECFQMLALGARCGVGDQLPPAGKLDAATYDLIGAVYAQVEQKEPWCEDAEAITEIAVFNVEATGRAEGRIDPASLGAYRMLLEGRHQFDFVDGENDWSGYRVVLLPDKVLLDEALAQKTEDYLAGGGALLLSHESGLMPDMSGFALAGMPAVYRDRLPYHPDFLKPLGSLADGLPDTQFVMYERGLKVEPVGGAETLAEIWEPFFNRAWDHFCSHFHTPIKGKGPDPGALQKGRILYFPHPVFATYGRHGMLFCRQLVLNALRRLLPDPLVQTDAPTTLHVTWNRQPSRNRSVAHLLHYIPEKRTLAEDSIEDVIPLHDITVRFRTLSPRRVYLAPKGAELPYTTDGAYIAVRVPVVRGHAMVVMED